MNNPSCLCDYVYKLLVLYIISWRVRTRNIVMQYSTLQLFIWIYGRRAMNKIAVENDTMRFYYSSALVPVGDS